MTPATRRRDRGQATVELAVALPAVVALLVLLLAAGSAVVAQVRVADAARAGARAVIAGETSTQVTAVVHELAGAGASVGIASGDLVEVTVTRPLGGPLGRWGLAARAVARAPAEPGAP